MAASKGFITEGLTKIEGLELVINGDYTKCIEELKPYPRGAAMANSVLTEPYFLDEQAALNRLEEIIWSDGIV